MPHYEVLEWHSETVNFVIGTSGNLSTIDRLTISEDPEKYAKLAFRPYCVCPICGRATNDMDRCPATLHPILNFGNELGTRTLASYGIWTHISCLRSCPQLGEPSPIPW